MDAGPGTRSTPSISSRRQGAWTSLPEKLRETAELRVNNPELTLSQLAELFQPPISKSALNHRLRKLVELSGASSDT